MTVRIITFQDEIDAWYAASETEEAIVPTALDFREFMTLRRQDNDAPLNGGLIIRWINHKPGYIALVVRDDANNSVLIEMTNPAVLNAMLTINDLTSPFQCDDAAGTHV